ncbi:MAG: nucleotide exchange factor GrpE, partial [Kiritimatiellae bacterium]|nr:nucleotide exchange factor GrpE [Kiritimatiellia bacterium]
LAASNDRYVRLMADFDNFRRRVARERTEVIQRANENLLTELLPVLDHFELAIARAPDATLPYVEGVRMVYDQMASVLSKAGLQAFDAGGVTFDHTCHHAIAYQNSDSVPENGVIMQTRRGYRLGDRILRHANVIVSSGAPQTEPAAPPAPAGEAVPEGDAVTPPTDTAPSST